MYWANAVGLILRFRLTSVSVTGSLNFFYIVTSPFNYISIGEWPRVIATSPDIGASSELDVLSPPELASPSSPAGSMALTGPLPVYRRMLMSPPANPIGSFDANCPVVGL